MRVPFATTLKFKCLNGGELKVAHVTAVYELSSLKGALTATNITGSVVANSLNGMVLVTGDVYRDF